MREEMTMKEGEKSKGLEDKTSVVGVKEDKVPGVVLSVSHLSFT